ncbi:MAG: hypothetical protein ACLQVG_15755 [Terriglobia bacterium]
MGIPSSQLGHKRACRRLFLLPLALALSTIRVSAQQVTAPAPQAALPVVPEPDSLDHSRPREDPQANQSGTPSASGRRKQSPAKPADQGTSPANAQSGRILGIIPNFHFVSPGVKPPPPTPKEDFVIASRNSFDYSSFIFAGFSSLWAEGMNTHAQLGKGVPGFGRYYWRGFVDKVDGNYMVYFAMPTLFHQDERYYALGKGSLLRRVAYAASRVIITPNDQGRPSFNASELLGRGIAETVSASYYPSQARTPGALARRWGWAVGRDAVSDALRELSPDIVRLLHRIR